MKRWRLNGRSRFLALCVLWGALPVAMWRTQSFGFTWLNLLADAVMVFSYVLPIAALAVIDLPWRRACANLLVRSIAAIIFAETFAGAQEWLLIQRHGQNPGRELSLKRWPPFSDHHIGYSPGYGWFGGD
jgi:hypothetical protein